MLLNSPKTGPPKERQQAQANRPPPMAVAVFLWPGGLGFCCYPTIPKNLPGLPGTYTRFHSAGRQKVPGTLTGTIREP